ncbi:MAG: hypothetical protein OER43_00750 [Gammaproteobacteria bacterium]|nr:hypothetical protein [Gammaproteobacteria bacterium]MDH3412861.1 hypothetical protein [Gammaproteobacteria bacterium]
MAFRLALLTWQELQLSPLVLRLVLVQSFFPSAISCDFLPDASFAPLGRTKSFALTFAAPQGLQGLQGLHAFFPAQGLHGLQAFFAAQGLHGLQAFFFIAQGLQGLQAFFAEQGLHAWAMNI